MRKNGSHRPRALPFSSCCSPINRPANMNMRSSPTKSATRRSVRSVMECRMRRRAGLSVIAMFFPMSEPGAPPSRVTSVGDAFDRADEALAIAHTIGIELQRVRLGGGGEDERHALAAAGAQRLPQ